MTDKNKEIKLIALDVDGTLLNSKLEMSERMEKALRAVKAQGVTIVLATGKTRNAVQALVKKLELTAPGIFLQGLITYDAEGKVIHQQTLDPKLARRVITFVEERGFSLLAYSGARILVKANNKEVEEGITKYHEMPPEVVGPLQNLLDTTPLNKMMAVGEARAITALRWQLNAMIGGAGKLVQAGIPTMLEILPPGGSKGAALKGLCKHLNISADEVLAIGDGENDIEMIKFARIGVAMGNSAQMVKDAADHVVGTNDEDGAADAIERFVLKAAPAEKAEAKPAEAETSLTAERADTGE